MATPRSGFEDRPRCKFESSSTGGGWARESSRFVRTGSAECPGSLARSTTGSAKGSRPAKRWLPWQPAMAARPPISTPSGQAAASRCGDGCSGPRHADPRRTDTARSTSCRASTETSPDPARTESRQGTAGYPAVRRAPTKRSGDQTGPVPAWPRPLPCPESCARRLCPDDAHWGR